jgi:hypothetical protein
MERAKDMRTAPDTCFQSLHCLLMSFMHIVCCARPHWPPTCCDSHSICAGVVLSSYLQGQTPDGISRLSLCS